ncbi:MAG: nitrous oxide-stimulated promoter family protein [Bacillota bacterium]
MAFSRVLEEKTVNRMVHIYCQKMHKGKRGRLCPECTELLTYAANRIERCPHGDRKPVCGKCKVHCFKPVMREAIKQAMRYSGPRMIYKSPLLSVRYFYRKYLKS